LLAPGDPDIATNLQLAQKQAGITATDPYWLEKLSGLLSASDWAYLGSGAWVLFCAGLWARAAWPWRQTLFALSNTAAVLILVAAVAAIVISSSHLHEAVVIDKKASALISPFPAAQVMFSPSAGETVTIEKSYDDFLLMKDQAGHTGWIDKTQVTLIIPS
jgi:hypothetical protein